MDYQVFPRGQLLSMAGRHVPQVGLYNLNSQNTGAQYVASALHDLNTVDSRNGDMESLGDADQDAAAGDSLDNEEDESNSGVIHFCLETQNCMSSDLKELKLVGHSRLHNFEIVPLHLFLNRLCLKLPSY